MYASHNRNCSSGDADNIYWHARRTTRRRKRRVHMAHESTWRMGYDSLGYTWIEACRGAIEYFTSYSTDPDDVVQSTHDALTYIIVNV